MIVMKKLFTLLFILINVSVFAQIFENNRGNNRNDRGDFMQNRRRAPSLTMGVQLVDPLGEFGEKYDGTPVGLTGLFTVNWGRSPFEFGFGASWNSMGSTGEDIMVYIGDDQNGNELFSDGRMRVSSNIYTYHAVGRFKPLAGPVQPYVDLLGGFKTFSTKYEIKDDESREVIEKNRELRDFALSSGWAAGLKVRLNDYMMIEGRFEKLRGGEVDFMDSESLVIKNEGELEYTTETARSNSNVFTLGISVEF